jgi:hypothetical protein
LKYSLKITASILTPFSKLLPNLYYSPIKKLLGNSVHSKSRSKEIAYDFVEKVFKCINHYLFGLHLKCDINLQLDSEHLSLRIKKKTEPKSKFNLDMITCKDYYTLYLIRFRFMEFNVTFNNISVISWRSVLLL